jgi:DedD protein
MDRRVKERLIGASILVALIVLVVPELLSGPKSAVPSAKLAVTFPSNAPEPTRNVTLDLATSKAPANSEVEPAETAGSPATAARAATSGEASPDPASPTAGSPSSAAPSSAAPSTAAPSSIAPLTAAPPTAARLTAAPPSVSTAAAPSTSAAAATLKPVESAAPSPTSLRAAWAVQLGSFASRANADNLSRQLRAQGFAVYVLPGGSGGSARYRVRVGPLADRGSAEQTAARLKSIGHVSSLVAPAG